MKRKNQNIIVSGIDIVIIKSQIIFSTLISKISLNFQGCSYGLSFTTSWKCFFKAYKSGSIIIRDRVKLFSAHRTNRIGLLNPVLIETIKNGIIEIGNDSGCSSVVISARSSIKIGNRVKIGANVRILDHDFHSLDYKKRNSKDDKSDIKSKPIVISDDVFIGTNSIILKGVKIGRGVIVGAGSVVCLKEIPENVIIAGNPAKIINRNSKHV